MSVENLPSEPLKLNRMLTPEEAEKRARELGERDSVYVLPSPKGGEIILNGTKHTESRNIRIQNMEDRLLTSNASIVLIEGGSPQIEQARLIPLDSNPEEVIKLYKEEVYMAWLGLRQGKEIASWDLNPRVWLEQISETEFTKDEVMAWFLGNLIKFLIESKKINPSELRGLMKIGFGDLQILEELGYKITDEKIEEICLKFFGKKLSEIKVEDCERVSTPRTTQGRTNLVARKMNELRDNNAIRVINETAQGHKNIFVVGGRDHVITWQPLITNMF